jgi:hypothetical protein
MKRGAYGWLAAAIGVAPFVPMLLLREVPSFRDHTDYFIPLRWFTASRLAAGELPLWNRFNAAGEPWLANPQTGVFYPPAWLMVALPFETGYVGFLAFHVALAAVGTYLLCRRWLDPEASLMGSVVVALGGPSLSLLDVSNNLATWAWYPLAAWLAFDAGSGARRYPRALSSLVLAMMFLGGEPLLAASGWLLWGVIAVARREAARLVLPAAATIATALLLIAVQLVPFAFWLRGSDRAAGLLRSETARESLAPVDWVTATLTLASPGGGFTLLPSSQHFIPTLYLGIVPVILAFVALFALGRERDTVLRRVTIGALALFAAGALLAARPAAGSALWSLAGLDMARYPARFAPVAGLAVAILAAVEFRAVRESGVAVRLSAIAAAAVTFVLAVFLYSDGATPLRISLSAGAMLLAGAAVLLVPRLFSIRGAAIAIVLLVAVDLAASSAFLLRSQKFDPRPGEFTGLIDPAARMARLPERRSDQWAGLWGEGRRKWISGYLNLLERRENASTAAPVIDAHYLRYHDLALSGQRLDLLDFLSVVYIMSDRELFAPQLARFTRIDDVTVYRNRGAMPPVRGAVTWREVADRDAAAREVASGIDARSILLVSGGAVPPPPQSGSGEVTIDGFRMEDERVSFTVIADAPSIAVVNQTASEGWSVTVDGERREPLVANGIFRAVAVGAGRHDVVWRYASPFFLPSVIVSLLVLAACIVSTARFFAQRRRADR